MKKTLILMSVALLLNGCRYVNTEEQYLKATESPELTFPEGIDKPNTTSTLSVPKAKSQSALATIDKSPPDMPIRTKLSEDGELKIENRGGYPVLTVKSVQENAWTKMQALVVENWQITDKSETDCKLLLIYIDQEAETRKNSNFIKKIFTREGNYSDYSGVYKLSCEVKGSVVEIKFSKQDDSTAKSFLADNVMNKLYDLFEESLN